MRKLQYGMKGSDVVELKTYLNYLGLRDDAGKKLDVKSNVFDVPTRQSVKRGQRKIKETYKDMVVDGIYGNQSQTMFPTLDPKKPVTPTKPTTPTQTIDDWFRSPRWLSDDDIVQDTLYFCALNISQQVLYELYGIRVKESEMEGVAGTTTNGTGHEGIAEAIKYEAEKHGFPKPKVEFISFKDIGWEKLAELIKDPRVGVFFHDLYRNKWGHYEYPVAVNLKLKTVKIANSLSGGYIESRSFSEHESYMSGISQPSVGIVTRV